ncbi:hypothetical protein CKO28_04230 [Rhodovibrio sodomensis]|uniref:Uncharacterized protein n=1 Tax=Rhodovibrio sodomensis TaxID=1088 RepID=A0ABS1DCX4_9PROT|nr:hypothetical protein [Rhodovibrio sodomensis]MBK1667250.1 hypothetical protein [Rhodovibrio sodomensis]
MSARRRRAWRRPGPALAAGLLGVALGIAGSPAAAQDYRTNLPTVLDGAGRETPSAEQSGPGAAAIRADFARAYANVGSPRMAVYWNRPFSDRLSQWVALGRLRIEQRASGAGTFEGSDGRQGRMRMESTESASVVLEGNAGQDQRDRRLDPLAAAEFETGFSRPMLAGGAELVDRATIMRVTESNIGRGAGQERLDDAQLVETEALKSFADLLVQITMLDDADAPLDTAFRVRVTRITDGVIVADMVTRGRKELKSQQRSWTATAGGYVEDGRTESVRVAALGRFVARETMQALAERWR